MVPQRDATEPTLVQFPVTALELGINPAHAICGNVRRYKRLDSARGKKLKYRECLHFKSRLSKDLDRADDVTFFPAAPKVSNF